MTKIIGLTGGIGSGKLRLQIIFNLWDSRLYSDDEARKIMQTAEVIMRLKKHLEQLFEELFLKETN
jgi:dephospho-CoA kinase